MPTKLDKPTITIHRTHYTLQKIENYLEPRTRDTMSRPEDSLILIGSLNCSHWSVMVDAYSTNSLHYIYAEYVNMLFLVEWFSGIRNAIVTYLVTYQLSRS